MAQRLARGKWGDPQVIMQSLGRTVANLESRLTPQTAPQAEEHMQSRQQQEPTTAEQARSTDKQQTTQDAHATTSMPAPVSTRTQASTSTQPVTLTPASTTSQPTGQQDRPALDILKTKLQKQTPVNTAPQDTRQPTQPATNADNSSAPASSSIQLLPRREPSTVRLVPNNTYLATQNTQRTQPQTTPQPTVATFTTPSAPSAPEAIVRPFDTARTPTPTRMFTSLQHKATKHTQQPDLITTQTVGPAVQAWQMVEQVPTNDQDKEEYERNRFEFKCCKGTIRYPAPPTELWHSTQADLMELYKANSVHFSHRYLAALFASIGPSVFDQIDKIRFYARDQILRY